MRVEPLVRPSLTDLVVERIRDLIDREGLHAGDRLPGEMDLVQQLGVSRPVLREAIGRLAGVGLLSVQRGRGTFVAARDHLLNCAAILQSAMAISPKDLLQFAEVRAAIECFAVRRAAELATPQDLDEIESLCWRMDSSGLDYLEAIRIDFQFHRKLVDLGGNELMRNIIGVVHEFVMAGMVHTTPNPRDRSWSRPLHAAILEAVRARDPDAAEAAMRTHMKAVFDRLQAAANRKRRKQS
jgi:GntR family transcriptional regulator, transcriptional repressor for pyruvate dehydrogenase complex